MATPEAALRATTSRFSQVVVASAAAALASQSGTIPAYVARAYSPQNLQPLFRDFLEGSARETSQDAGSIAADRTAFDLALEVLVTAPEYSRTAEDLAANVRGRLHTATAILRRTRAHELRSAKDLQAPRGLHMPARAGSSFKTAPGTGLKARLQYQPEETPPSWEEAWERKRAWRERGVVDVEKERPKSYDVLGREKWAAEMRTRATDERSGDQITRLAAASVAADIA